MQFRIPQQMTVTDAQLLEDVLIEVIDDIQSIQRENERMVRRAETELMWAANMNHPDVWALYVMDTVNEFMKRGKRPISEPLWRISR